MVVLTFLLLARANGQDTTHADMQVQLAQSALGREQPDSVYFYLQQARALYLKGQNEASYYTHFMDIAPTLFTKWSKEVHSVEIGIQVLKELQQDLQQVLHLPKEQELAAYYQIARGYYYRGLAYKNAYNIKEANASFDSCWAYAHANLARLQQLPYKETALEQANHYNILGVAYNARGDALHALEEFQQVLTIRLAELDAADDRIASIYFNIGNAYSNLKLYNKALDAYTRSIKIREKAPNIDHARLASMYFNVGAMYNDKGEYDNAILFFNRAQEFYDTYPQEFYNVEALTAEVSTYLAICYQNKGAYQESSNYHEQSVQKYQQSSTDNAVKIADYYSNQAILADLTGDYNIAVGLYEKALQVYQEKLPTNDLRLIKAHNNLGNAYAENGQYAQALATFQGVLPYAKQDTSQQGQWQYASLISDLGLIYFYKKDFTTAKDYNLQALEILQKINNKKSYLLAVVYNNLAKIAEAEKNHREALQYIQQALGANHAHFDPENLDAIPSSKDYFRYDFFVESLLFKGHLLRTESDNKLNALQAARAVYLVVDSVLTQVQNELIASEDKIRLSEKMDALSEAAIDNCLQLATVSGDHRYWEEAFQYAEKSKNTVLTQSITANHAKHFAGIPDSLIALEDQLKSDVRYFKLKLLEQPDSLATILYQNELFNAQQHYRALVQYLEKSYPLYYQLKYDRSIPRIAALQLVIPEASALVSYFVGDSILYSFIISKHDFQVFKTPLPNNFEDEQVGLRKSIQYQLNEDYIKLANSLYQQLFPFQLSKNITSLIIIPDGNLSKLPFETLLTQKVNPLGAVDFSKLPYLINQYQVSYALSGALFYQQQLMPTDFSEAQDGLLAYAPVFDKPQDINSFSSGTRNPLTAANTGRTLTADGHYVAALPATADEVQSIANVFKEKGQKTSIYLFQNANENQLKHSDITHSKYLHIATHGFINEEQPDLSGLLLFPDSIEQEDHILYSGEVYNLNLHAQLVVLSACETGLGKVANGEGLLGLSRAFFYAGAENLIVSLWKVQDRATADLMVRFYREHLNSPTSNFAFPLRQAKLHMIHTQDFSHPYYWSAFVLLER